MKMKREKRKEKEKKGSKVIRPNEKKGL